MAGFALGCCAAWICEKTWTLDDDLRIVAEGVERDQPEPEHLKRGLRFRIQPDMDVMDESRVSWHLGPARSFYVIERT